MHGVPEFAFREEHRLFEFQVAEAAIPVENRSRDIDGNRHRVVFHAPFLEPRGGNGLRILAEVHGLARPQAGFKVGLSDRQRYDGHYNLSNRQDSTTNALLVRGPRST